MPLPVVNPQHSPAVQGFERLARDAAQRFRGKNLRIRRSPIVHATGWYRWIGTLYLPGPACHTGWAGVGAQGDLHAVDLDQPITCRKCQHTEEYRNVMRFAPSTCVQLDLLDSEPVELVLFSPT